MLLWPTCRQIFYPFERNLIGSPTFQHSPFVTMQLHTIPEECIWSHQNNHIHATSSCRLRRYRIPRILRRVSLRISWSPAITRLRWYSSSDLVCIRELHHYHGCSCCILVSPKASTRFWTITPFYHHSRLVQYFWSEVVCRIRQSFKIPFWNQSIQFIW